MIQRIKPRTARIALFAVAHKTYDAQFEGLFDKLKEYHRRLVDTVGSYGVETEDLGLVTDPRTSLQTAYKINGGAFDLVICNMVTYATSSVFAPLIKEVNVPVILAALQPRKALDYENTTTFVQLENDNICSVSEFVCAAVKMGKKVTDAVIGSLDDPPEDLREWCEAAKALHALKGARIGLMGHTLESMYDLHTDPVAISRDFGLHVPLVEPEELIKYYREAGEDQIRNELKLIDEEFDTPDPKSDPVTEKLSDSDKLKAARGSAALKRLVKEKDLDGLAYYFEGTEGDISRETASNLIVGNSFLNAMGIPACGEFDLKTVIAMLIMDRLDAGGSLGELHPLDLESGCILVGHDGPHHIGIAQGKPVIRSLKKYHGKPGGGASVEFKIKEGDLTMFGIAENGKGGFKFIVGEGVSKKGPIPATGNTNTRCFFEPDTVSFVKKWVMEGPTHHCALGVGRRASVLKKIADCLGIEFVWVK